MNYWCAMFEEWQEMQRQFINKLPMNLPNIELNTKKKNPWEFLHLSPFMTWGKSAVKQSMDLQSHWLDHWLGQMQSGVPLSPTDKVDMINHIQESMSSWSENQTELWTYWFKMIEESTDSFEDSQRLVNNLVLWKSTVENSLTSQTDWLDQWTKDVKVNELSTEEFFNAAQKIQEAMNGCIELQFELWSQWFDFLDVNNLNTKSKVKSTAKKETTKETKKALIENMAKDNLEQISGIGPAIAKKLHSQGIISFNQIAELTEKEIDRLEKMVIKFPGRIRRESWVDQAISILKKNIT